MSKKLLTSAIALVAAASLSAFAVGGAQAAKILKLGYAVAEGNAYDTFAVEFKKDLEKRTNGSVKVKNFCCF